MANISWKTSVSGDFADASNWSTGTVPGTLDTAEIEASGSYTVTSSTSETVSRLILEGDATLDIAGGVFKADAVLPSVTIGAAATLLIGGGATFDWAAKSDNRTYTFAGAIDVAAGGELSLSDTHALTGGGVINLGGAGSQIVVASEGAAPLTLDSTIQGAGTISAQGGAGFTLDLNILDADSSSQPLVLQAGVFAIDAALLEATNGGDLVVGAPSGSNRMNSLDTTVLVAGFGSQIQVDSAGLDATQGTVTSGGEIVVSDGAGLSIASLTVSAGGRLDSESGSSLGGGVTAAPGGIVELDSTTITAATLATSGNGVFETIGGNTVLNVVTNEGAFFVEDGNSLTVEDGLVNSGLIFLQSTGDDTGATVQTLFDDGFGKTNADHIFTLSGAGVIAMSDDTDNLINAKSAGDILANDGNTISGAGQIGGGSAMGIDNDGVIDATGAKNALVVDVATGKVTNQVHGVLEGAGAGGLSLSGGTFSDSGVVEALDGSSVTFDAGATLSNDFKGTLTGGVWEASDTGDGATLDLNGADITTDAAKIVLSGAGSVFETGSTALEESLTTIASTGKLELLADRAWLSALGLDDNGLLQLGGGAFAAAGLTLGASGTLSGFGDIPSPLANAGLVDGDGAGLTLAGPVANSGTISADHGTVDLTGSVTGTGTLKVYGGSMLEIGGSLASSQGVAFATGIHAGLKIDDPSAFASTIADLGLGDTIDLASTDATGARISGDTLAITLMGGGTLNYSLTDPGSNVRVVASSDGSGGTDLTLYKETAKSVAGMRERMAGLTSPSVIAVPTHTAPSPPRLTALAAPSG